MQRLACSFWAVLALISLDPFAPSAQAQADAKVNFQRDIRPILSENCFACHGPDEKQRMANLRLDTKEGAFTERGDYRILFPGNAANSRLYQKISSRDKALHMPPPGSGRALTGQQIDLIRRWIDEGAAWETHWAYLAPQRPALPRVSLAAWPRNPIDQFVLARLEREGLRPSPEAAKTSLLRRLSLDLTGLPPTLAEVDAYLADKSADAYEKQVERLLRSSRHAERLAMQWLDLARYADTHGYHIDSHRDMWPWRDWLIGAFRRNLPFDQLTIEQLAGDLLPSPTLEQKIATGFNRNHMINFEGGAIPEEYQNEYVVDRVETTATVWMGMTLGCARCHDHKYDPITQKEFYRLYAFFNTIPEKGLDGRKGNAEPLVQIPSPAQKIELERITGRIAAMEKAMPEKEIATLQEEWEKARASSVPLLPREGLAAHYEMDGHLADTSGQYQHARSLRGGLTYSNGPVFRAADFDGETHLDLGYRAAPPEDRFSLALWVRPTGKLEMGVLQKVDEPQHRRGFELFFEEFEKLPDLKRGARLYIRLIHRWPDQLVEIRTRERLIQSSWSQITLCYQGSGKASGLRLYLDGQLADVEILRDALSGPISNARPLEIGNQKLRNRYKGQLDDLRIYHRMLEPAEIEQLAVHYPIRALLSDSTPRRAADQKERKDKLRDYFLTYDAPEQLRRLHAQRKGLEAEKEALHKTIPTAMVMEEMAKPRETFILGRGDYRNQGEKVAPGVPGVLPPLPPGAPANRLGLARWLMDPSHPLTARVAVNRYWQLYFGSGLVKTAEDFGSQGEPPAHPELLDWLATEFLRSGWDIRGLERLIVTSATYRQASRVTPELLEKDPENRLLARASRFRLPAEMLRDNALAISGLLEEQAGGPGVYPYQPKGVWEDIAYGDVYSAQSYTLDTGKDLYRRSLYTFFKRTAPPPSLAAFDAPDREKCVARRAMTNTPLQALVLMNDPTYVEAARVLARRMITEAGGDPGKRIRLGFRLATSRAPSPGEQRILRHLAGQQLAVYRRDREAALRLLKVGESAVDPHLETSELAAWTTVASAILNLDETITRE